MKYLLDTHAAIWAYEKDPKLPQRVRALIDTQPQKDFVIAYVTLVEVARLLHFKKLAFSKTPLEWLRDLSTRFVPQLPTAEVSWRSVCLDWEHRDPADRLICATALEHGLTLITCDQIITEWGGVPILWE